MLADPSPHISSFHLSLIVFLGQCFKVHLLDWLEEDTKIVTSLQGHNFLQNVVKD